MTLDDYLAGLADTPPPAPVPPFMQQQGEDVSDATNATTGQQTALEVLKSILAALVDLRADLARFASAPAASPSSPPRPAAPGQVDGAAIVELWNAVFGERLGVKAQERLLEVAEGDLNRIYRAVQNVQDGMVSGKITARPNKPLSYVCAVITRTAERQSQTSQAPAQPSGPVPTDPPGMRVIVDDGDEDEDSGDLLPF